MASKKKKIELRAHTEEKEPYMYLTDYTKEDFEELYAKLKEHPKPEEQENVVGWGLSDQYARVDVCLIHSQIKYILEFNRLCREGKGILKYADSSHFSYWIDKSYLRPFALKRETEISEERKKAASERLKTMREAKKESQN